MRYVTRKDIQKDSRLAFDIYNSDLECIAETGFSVDDSLLEYLEKQEYRGIYIQDSLTKDIRVNPFVEPKMRAKMMNDIKFCHVESLRKHAAVVVKELKQSGEMHLDYLDPRSIEDYIYAHSVNVAVISGAIAIRMNLGYKDIENVVFAAFLHDVGKMDLPYSINFKTERLTQEEYLTMKLHPSISVKKINEKGGVMDDIKRAVLCHHENEDGSGYPNQISADEIPLWAKIIHVADVYDALTAFRPYKSPYSPVEALDYVKGGRGIMFYEKAVNALASIVPAFPRGTEVLLSNGIDAIIMKNSFEDNGRSFVLTVRGEILNLSRQGFSNYSIISKMEHADFNVKENESKRSDMIRGVKHFRIMIVDDQKTNLMLLRDILEDYYELTLLKSGEQALTYLENNVCPDLILMDINMPGLNGIDTAAIIQGKTNSMVPILFVSSNNDINTVLSCRNLGCAGYIVRPYNSVYIKSEIKRILTGEGDTL